MNPASLRMACHMHVMKRASQRGIVITADDIVRYEALMERARPAYERPGAARYLLTVKSAAGRRMRVVYDVELRCMVSVWHRFGRRGAMRINRQIDCIHLDGLGLCRIHKAPWWLRWLAPKGRQRCIEEVRRDFILQDAGDFPPCADRTPDTRRPVGPPPPPKPDR
ncbi:hypothetical protein [Shumkonia mesophila]|uniref:hypothetical protein n=1 Tax=Shumkonia mesophila TaxID=2838854 RepID=UPI0029348EDF|nr:hypothetical protein [Shumkonia mesophila]